MVQLQVLSTFLYSSGIEKKAIASKIHPININILPIKIIINILPMKNIVPAVLNKDTPVKLATSFKVFLNKIKPVTINTYTTTKLSIMPIKPVFIATVLPDIKAIIEGIKIMIPTIKLIATKTTLIIALVNILELFALSDIPFKAISTKTNPTNDKISPTTGMGDNKTRMEPIPPNNFSFPDFITYLITFDTLYFIIFNFSYIFKKFLNL